MRGHRAPLHPDKPLSRAAPALVAAALLAGQAPAQTPPPSPRPPILEAETSTTATLPPATPYRLFLGAGSGFAIIDGKAGKMEGTVHGGEYAVLDIAPDNSRFYVAETYWTRGNRGERVDLLSTYDSEKLELQSEVRLPGRLIAGGRTNYFSVSADGRRGYVFDLAPATAVQVVDLERSRFLGTIETPGCGMVYPFRSEGFASLCADGSLATVLVDRAGRGTLTRGQPFFDAEQDPVFEESIVDRATGKAFFVTLTGRVTPTMLGAKPEMGAAWTLQEAAGLAPATTGVQHKTWRPGGRRPFAYHRESDTLYVLMHEGKHWSHYDPGTELWAIRAGEKRVLGRFPLPTAGRLVGVSQGRDPLLYVAGEGGWLWILDPATGRVLKQMSEFQRPGQIRTVGF